MDEELTKLLEKLEHGFDEATPEEEEFRPEPTEEPQIRPEEEQRIEQLFTQAREDRSKAYELKRELDRLKIFADYENRFLDLFKKPDAS
jgi:hypothetical protein